MEAHRHRRPAIAPSDDKSQSASLRPTDDEANKYHKTRSYSSRRSTSSTGLIVFGLGMGCLFYYTFSLTARSTAANGGSAGRIRNIATKETSAGVGVATTVKDIPDWTLNLKDLTPSEVALTDPSYGKTQLTGRYRFIGSPLCSKNAMCVAFYPEVELSHHLDREEALDMLSLQFQQQIGNPVPKEQQVIGNKVHIDPRVDENVAILTRHGYKGGLPGGQINQDRSIIVSPYMVSSTASTENDFLIALFDGHGDRGEFTSELAVSTFPSLLAQKLQNVPISNGMFEEEKLKEAASSAYAEIDRKAAITSGAGCTATSILRIGDEVYFINTADSRSFLATYIKSKRESSIEFITSEHKPHLPEERERIESMGGEVMDAPPPQPGVKIKFSSRVLTTLLDGSQLGLAMSRSLGDPEAGKIGVIPTPDITHIKISQIKEKMARAADVDLSDVELFAVAASDGIYDHMEPDEVAQKLSKALYDSDALPPGQAGLLRAFEELIMESSKRWITNLGQAYRDDISIAISRIVT